MRERDIEKKVVQYAKDRGMLVYKFVSPGNAGVPDRILHHNGITFYIEFKAPGETPSVHQEMQIRRISGQSIPVYIVDNVDQGKRLIDAYTKERLNS